MRTNDILPHSNCCAGMKVLNDTISRNNSERYNDAGFKIKITKYYLSTKYFIIFAAFRHDQFLV